MDKPNISPEQWSKLHAMMDAAAQEMVPPDLRAKGWVYRDLPGWLAADRWTELLERLGVGNYQIVAGSQRSNGDSRGQFFLSPQAIENLNNWRAELRAAAIQPNSVPPKDPTNV